MTHEELLAKLSPARYIIKDEAVAQLNALRAVVKLHKPNEEGFCSACFVSVVHFPYPCPTIQAIEKELK